ncbi:MAG: hypothetical protein CH6_0017 [Candidatus Kapaibacterium sp.]|nr:MAG: hypothetical protein CH6_0017 [Candidatus Kapabacteria bacterium]
MIKDLVFGIIILILLVLLGYKTITQPGFVVKEVQKQDTIIIRDTIKLEAKARIVYRTKIIAKTDSSITKEEAIDSTSFIACIDTIVAKTTINTCYYYPENKFEMLIKYQPDTITKYTIIEKPIIKYEVQKTNWTQDALKIGGGIVVGFLLGRIK